MKNHFRYVAPSPLNNLAYAAALAVGLSILHSRGQAILDWFTHRFSDGELFVGFGFAGYLTVFWGWGLFYLALDRSRPAWAERYRIQTAPTGSDGKSSSPSTASAIRVVLANQFFGTLPVLVAVYFAWKGMGVSASDPVPGIATVLWKLGAMVLIEEVLFFTAHFLLHTRPLFRTIHHIHHRFRQPIGISTHYVHYVEHLTGNLVPIFSAILLVRADLVTTAAWVALAVTNAIHTHSDYAFPWMPSSVNHDFHHWLARENYGVLGLCDRIFGTDREYRKLAEGKAMNRA